MRIHDNGNVGINVTDPDEKLEVAGKTHLGGRGQDGGAYIAYATLSETQGGAATILGNAVYAGTTNNTFRRTKGDAGNYIRMTYNKGICFHTNVTGNTSDDYDINNHEQMRITTGGSVGIGTNDPKGRLHIEGDKSYSLGYLDATSDLHIGNDTMSSAVGAYAGSISFGSTNESNLQAASIVAIQTDTDYNEIGLAFFTQHSRFGSHDLVESMRITNDGKVGIGTTSPQQELDVDGVIKQKVYTVSNLPSASTSTIGARAFVSDSYYPFSSSYLGSQISGGGSNFSPVYSDGSYWYMG